MARDRVPAIPRPEHGPCGLGILAAPLAVPRLGFASTLGRGPSEHDGWGICGWQPACRENEHDERSGDWYHPTGPNRNRRYTAPKIQPRGDVWAGFSAHAPFPLFLLSSTVHRDPFRGAHPIQRPGNARCNGNEEKICDGGFATPNMKIPAGTKGTAPCGPFSYVWISKNIGKMKKEVPSTSFHATTRVL